MIWDISNIGKKPADGKSYDEWGAEKDAKDSEQAKIDAVTPATKLHAICEAERYLSHSPSAGICVREPGGGLIWRSDKQ